MNSIRKLIRGLGFDIARYPKSKKNASSRIKASDRSDILIPTTAAHLALKGVGRIGRSPFTYFQRPNMTSTELDEIENIWWNAHSKLIENVWVLSDDVNELYRANYISKAASFFKKDTSKAIVLDLGCGSGWFGRIVADQDLEYFGIDFSSSQIELANKKRINAGNSQWLHYYCTTDFKQVKNIQEINSVFIHAFLHHLYWDELHSLFAELKNTLPRGCRIFIVEPIYPGFNKSNQDMRLMDKLISDYRKYVRSIKSELIAEGIYNTELEDQLGNVFEESKINGFFFSPKEVPFELHEFEEFLNGYVVIQEKTCCGILNLETAQMIENIKSEKHREYYKRLLFPFVNHLDKFLLSNGYFENTPNTYFFTAFECILK